MKRKLTLIIIGVIIVLLGVIRLTFAYMKNKIIEDNAKTEVSIKTCAKIQLIDADSSSIKLENTYPMADSKGLETEGYEFKIQSSCDEYLSFNLYLTSLEGNGITDENIKYALTDKENNVLITDNLTSEKDGRKDFNEEELKQLEIGIKGKGQNIYKIYSNDIPLKGESTYKLYLWVDSKAGNETMHQTFKAGLSVKTYTRNKTLAEQIIESKDKTLIYHDGKCDYEGQENCTLEAGDLSYRYSGSSEIVENYVCLDGTTTEEKCSSDEDLYQIIGLFKNNLNLYEMKLIKHSPYLGADDVNWTGRGYYWGGSQENTKNTWKDSTLNTITLNQNYYNNLLHYIQKLITIHSYITVGNTSGNLYYTNVYEVYKNEIINPDFDNISEDYWFYKDRIGLMYITDYMYGTTSNNWQTTAYNFGNDDVKANNWIYINDQTTFEWLITRRTDSRGVFNVAREGHVDGSAPPEYFYFFAVRPVFYLESATKLANGTGSKDSPYRLLIS